MTTTISYHCSDCGEAVETTEFAVESIRRWWKGEIACARCAVCCAAHPSACIDSDETADPLGDS